MNRSWMTMLLLAVALPASAGVKDEILSAEKGWAQAVAGNNTAALESLYGDQLIYAHSSGIVETKREYIDMIRSGKRKYSGVEQESIRVEAYGDSAVAHYLARTSGVGAGKPFSDHVMVMHFWVKQGGKWRLVAHQTTKVP